MANQWPDSTSVTASPGVTLFKSKRAGGNDLDGVLAVSVRNTGSNPINIRVSNISRSAAEYCTIKANESATFEVSDNGVNQIDTITAWSPLGSTSTGSATKWR